MKFEQLKQKLNNEYKNNRIFVITYAGVIFVRNANVNEILKLLKDTFYVNELRFYVNDVKNKVFITIE